MKTDTPPCADAPGEAFDVKLGYKCKVVVRVAALGPCWEYLGAKDDKGYGQVWLEGRTQKIHRVSAKSIGIEAPQIRHKCDNPPCFRPEHLEGGDNADNQMDSVKRGRHANAKKTHCPKGHLYVDHIHTSVLGKHRRRCYTCENKRKRVR